MIPSPDEDTFVSAVKRHLDQSVTDLSPDIQGRLRSARREAVYQQATTFAWWRPALGFATAGALVLALTLFREAPPSLAPGPALEDLELLASADPVDFYEDLDFYHWLIEHDETG